MSSRLFNWLNLWMLGALGLCGLYGYALHLARNPDVSDAYRAYYIDRSSDLPVWLAEGRPGIIPPLVVGTPHAHTAPEIMLVGWSSPEPKQVWTLGKQAVLFFVPPDNLPPDRPYELVLQGVYLGGQQLVISSIAGTRTRRIYRDGEDLVIPLPSVSSGEGPVGVRLDLPNARAPGTQDARVLGFALQSVMLRERSP